MYLFTRITMVLTDKRNRILISVVSQWMFFKCNNTIGQNSTLLIHEATMEDELAEEARTKMHSTTSQAIQMGRQMCAKYTVLTHFSQRYARLPRLSAHILHDNASVGVAFDNMQVQSGNFAVELNTVDWFLWFEMTYIVNRTLVIVLVNAILANSDGRLSP